MFDDFKSETVVTIVVVIGVACFCFGLFVANGSATQALSWACGPCDHVADCGRYECRAGVDGWHLKNADVGVR